MPLEILRIVNILVLPVPLIWITTPRKLCRRSLLPSTILYVTVIVSPAWNDGTSVLVHICSLTSRITASLFIVATMNKDAVIRLVNEQMWTKTDVPSFQAGDTITVTYKIVEGNKERLQSFRGVVIQIKGTGKTKMFTIRKISNGIGVERIFPLYSPHIESIEVNKQGVVRRARIYYLRNLTGKKARIKEKRAASTK